MDSCLALGSWLAAVNGVGFVLAAWDKMQARRGGGRVPELVLLAVAGVAGWLGLGLAFLLVRHKVRKARFLAPFILVALASTLLVWWILEPLACLG